MRSWKTTDIPNIRHLRINATIPSIVLRSSLRILIFYLRTSLPTRRVGCNSSRETIIKSPFTFASSTMKTFRFPVVTVRCSPTVCLRSSFRMSLRIVHGGCVRYPLASLLSLSLVRSYISSMFSLINCSLSERRKAR